MNKKNIVCFDTHIVIWGVKKTANPEQEDCIPKAVHLIEKCEKDGIEIIIPSVVVAELLCILDDDEKNKLLGTLEKHFLIIPFDLHAALHYSQIWRRHHGLRAELGVTREQMKADFMIVSTAVARGASCIYSHDGPLRAFAKGHIEIKELPPAPPRQLSFDYEKTP